MFGKSEKELTQVQPDGATLRQHYQMAEKRGVKRPELVQPVIPLQVKYLWRWYCELKRSVGPLSWVEMKAWAELTNRKPNGWEIATLRAIDTEITR